MGATDEPNAPPTFCGKDAPYRVNGKIYSPVVQRLMNHQRVHSTWAIVFFLTGAAAYPVVVALIETVNLDLRSRRADARIR